MVASLAARVAGVFAAMEVWMRAEQRTLAELADLSNATLTTLERGLAKDGLFRHY